MSTIPKLIDSMKQSLHGASKVSYVDLEKDVKTPVRLINVLQYFWENEDKLSGKTDTCTDDCEHFQDRDFIGGDGCYGTVRDCQFKISVHHTEYQLLQVIAYKPIKSKFQQKFIPEKSPNGSHLRRVLVRRQVVRQGRKFSPRSVKGRNRILNCH